MSELGEPERSGPEGPDKDDDAADGGSREGGGISRRQVLVGGGGVVVGAAIGVGATLLIDDDGGGTKTVTAAAKKAAPASTTVVPQALTSGQARTLNAALGRLIPSDATGPGAEEAQVWRYIDGSLAGELSELLPMYTDALEDLEAGAMKTAQVSFAELEPSQQDQMLTELEGGKGPSGEAGAAFFATLREHALEGMFGDPAHGGNADFAGWKLIGYPGIKLEVSAAEQAVGTKVKPALKSTYDYPNFGISTGA